MTIYVVFGSCGEYSDRTEWTVRAYRTEVAAQEKVLRCTTAADTVEARISNGEDDWYDIEGGKRLRAIIEPEDPSYQRDYTGTRYYIETVELEDA